MYFSTFLKVIFVVSLCFLTLNVEAQRNNAVAKAKDPLSCLPSGSPCGSGYPRCCSYRCVRETKLNNARLL
ncbi:unnamed protein product [Rhizophagus irregularis]|nr:unnamed protein product [Rhizophagus irregularis]CAB5387286.1 unnamed protein product [Rhizophagus irregularis]